jgi:hypothetical protein
MVKPDTPNSGPGSETGGIRLLQFLGALIVLAYFFRYATVGLSAGFAADDPMNIYYYWSGGAGQLLRNLGLFFTTYMRPMGGVYYSLLYHFFGLNPLPYHVAILCLLLLNTFLAYRFGALITGSRLAGGLCSFLVAFHAGLIHLYFQPSFIYDILCFTFYFLAVNFYLSVRTRGVRMTIWRTVGFLLLYIGALESKEMAVTLPALMLLYEALWRPPARRSVSDVATWARTEALTPILAGVVTLAYALGKALGSDSLLRIEGYRPAFTGARYFESTSRFLNTLFYQSIQDGFFNARTVSLVAVLLLAIAWRLRQRRLFLMWLFIFIAPLPIAFLPSRGGASLYIPLVGWAVFAGSLLASASGAIAGWRILQRVPAGVTQGALVLCAVAAQWGLTAHHTAGIGPWVRSHNQLTASVIQQIHALQPSVKPGATIYVMNDVFDGFDTQFLFELTYHDRSVHVLLDRYAHSTPAEIERMDYVFTFENGKLKRLKGAEGGLRVRAGLKPRAG